MVGADAPASSGMSEYPTDRQVFPRTSYPAGQRRLIMLDPHAGEWRTGAGARRLSWRCCADRSIRATANIPLRGR